MSNIKHTLEFIKQEYKKKNYEFLDDFYSGSSYKHNIKCHCGYEWKQRYNGFQQGRGCPKCAGLVKHTLEFIKLEYSKRNYVFLDDVYKNNLYKHNIKCHCGYVWKQKYNKFQQGRGCPNCFKEKLKLNLDFVKEEYSKKNCEFLDDFYKNANSHHNIKCLTCNHEWKQTYGCFQQGQGCPKCFREKVKHSLEFVKQEYAKKNYEFLDDFYENASHPHNIKCLTCGYVWKQRYGDFQRGCGCPNCLHKNERKCREILEKLTTYKFPKKGFTKNQTGLYKLELDGYCQELNLAFEYDGEQHYMEIANWGNKINLKQRQARDLFKTEFCLKNNIKLIRIPYFVEDKEEFIKNELR